MRALLFLTILSISLCGWAQKNSLCEKAAKDLHEGDLIFLDIDNTIFEQVAKATQTWTSHVGVAIYNEGWFVRESTFPFSKITGLCDYLSKTQGDRVEIRRFKKGLEADQVLLLKKELESHMGVFYDTGFNFDSEKLFCSKLVYVSFKNALGIEVGVLKNFKTLLDENPDGDTTFWKWWFLGEIPWERRTVTPKDQLFDDEFVTVFKNGVD